MQFPPLSFLTNHRQNIFRCISKNCARHPETKKFRHQFNFEYSDTKWFLTSWSVLRKFSSSLQIVKLVNGSLFDKRYGQRRIFGESIRSIADFKKMALIRLCYLCTLQCRHLSFSSDCDYAFGYRTQLWTWIGH